MSFILTTEEEVPKKDPATLCGLTSSLNCRKTHPAHSATVVLIIATFGLYIPSFGQHEGHDMAAMGEDGKVVWRMPPMDMSMPMLPGLEMALPPTAPFMPGEGMDVSMFPEVRPRETYDLNDGDEIELVASLVRRSIDGIEFVAYGYNGQYPGPLIRARQGSSIIVHFRNEISMPTTVRWHGIRGDNVYDGTPVVTQDPVPKDSSFTYEVRFTDAGIFWYHPQVRADIQMDLGLYGMLLVEPSDESYYGPADREEILILDDLLIDKTGPLPWGEDAPTHVFMGRFGNVMQVNGSAEYELNLKQGEIVRFFVANAANSRTFNVTFDGQPLKVVASDLGRLEEEVMTTNVVIGPGERYIIDAQFDEPGEIEITNSIQAIDHFRGVFYPHKDHLGMIVVAADPDADFDRIEVRKNEEVSAELAPYKEHVNREPDKRLELSLRIRDLPMPIVRMMEIDTLYVPPIEWNDSMPMMNWLSTGAQVIWVLRDMDTGDENMEIYWDFDTGDVAKIRIFNNPKTFHPMNHPLHLHGQRFLVLETDGVPNPNLAWKDTAIIPVASTVDLLVEMSNEGEWVLHCHIAEHLHAGMMLSFGVYD